MMRKDVKLGFAIGGVLLAVVVVYVLVGTGGGEERQRPNSDATIVTEDTSTQRPSVASGSGNSPSQAAPSVTPVNQNNTASREPSHAGGSTELGSATGTPGSERTQAAGGARTADLTTPDTAAPAQSVAQNGSANSDAWNKALHEGLLMSATPTPPGGVSARSGSSGADPKYATIQGDDTRSASVPPPAAAASDDPRGHTTDALSAFGPATQPNDAASNASESTTAANIGSSSGSSNHVTGLVARATTHVVQKGETLAQISEAAYGSANFWPAIQRANPTLDPKKLHPGMTINLPAVDEVKPRKETSPTAVSPASAGLSPGRTAPSIDPRTQYVVAQNDSLYQISMKLYGKPSMVDKLYELNKETIGPDRAKLKLNMVLKLPEPPTQTAAR